MSKPTPQPKDIFSVCEKTLINFSPKLKNQHQHIKKQQQNFSKIILMHGKA